MDSAEEDNCPGFTERWLSFVCPFGRERGWVGEKKCEGGFKFRKVPHPQHPIGWTRAGLLLPWADLTGKSG